MQRYLQAQLFGSGVSDEEAERRAIDQAIRASLANSQPRARSNTTVIKQEPSTDDFVRHNTDLEDPLFVPRGSISTSPVPLPCIGQPRDTPGRDSWPASVPGPSSSPRTPPLTRSREFTPTISSALNPRPQSTDTSAMPPPQAKRQKRSSETQRNPSTARTTSNNRTPTPARQQSSESRPPSLSASHQRDRDRPASSAAETGFSAPARPPVRQRTATPNSQDGRGRIRSSGYRLTPFRGSGHVLGKGVD